MPLLPAAARRVLCRTTYKCLVAALGCLAALPVAAAPTTLLDTIDPDLSELPVQEGDPGPEFGAAVAADGDWLVVGMPRAITSSEPVGPVQGGRATLYRRVGDAWRFERPLTGNMAPSNEGARCGQGVGVVDGDPYLGWVVSCPSAPVGGVGAGAGYVVLRSTTGGSSFQGVAYGDAAGARLGASVAVTQTSDGVAYAVLGAPGAEAVHVYRRGAGEAAWTHDTTLVASNGAPGDLFGHSVAVAAAGSSGYPVWVAVGAPQRANLSGAVYVFRYSTAPTGWSQVAQVVAPSAQFGDLFGASVAYQPSGFNNFDDLLVVGAPNRYAGGDSSLDHRRGSVSVFRQGINAGSFMHDGDVMFNVFLCAGLGEACADRTQPMQLGAAVGVDADGIWAGAPLFDQEGRIDVGRAYRAERGPVFGNEQWWVRAMVSPGPLASDCVEDPNAWGRAGGRFGAALAPAASGGVAVGYPRRGCALEVPPYDVYPRTGQVRVFGLAMALFRDGFEPPN